MRLAWSAPRRAWSPALWGSPRRLQGILWFIVADLL